MDFAEEFEAFALELQADFVVLGAPHFHNGGGQPGHSFESLTEFVLRHDLQVLQKAGVMGKEDDLQMIGSHAGPCDVPGVLEEDAGFVEEGLEGEPFLVAALAPFRDVVLVNWPALELFRHHSHDVRVRVQPFDEAVSRLAVGEADVELLPDFERESCNLAVSGCHMFIFGYSFRLSSAVHGQC